MRSSLRLLPLGFALASLFAMGCQNKVSVDPDPDPNPDPECTEPEPEVPPGSWCPPSYQCIGGEWVDTGGDCPEPACPQTKPATGDDCAMIGQSCYYEEDIECGPIEQVQAICTDAGWQLMSNYCQPEPICPDEMPVPGTDCTGWYDAFFCLYSVQTPCGEQMANITCQPIDSGNVWTLEMSVSCGACDSYGTEAQCGADPACQWLTPGCDGNPVATGCYPVQGCDVIPCADTEVCVAQSYDPCYGSDCGACAASYFTCVPQP